MAKVTQEGGTEGMTLAASIRHWCDHSSNLASQIIDTSYENTEYFG